MNSVTFMEMEPDVLILGAGGAGMMCAIHAGRRGRCVMLLDHSAKIGGKILISGGGRCNFTNVGATPANYVSENPHFCKSALARYTPQNFIDMVESHGIAYHEKKLGQLFCDHSAQSVLDLLKKECQDAGAEFRLGVKIEKITRMEEGTKRFAVLTDEGEFKADSLVIATGGLSIPKIGATGFGYEVAKQFGLSLVERAPALDGFTLNAEDTRDYGGLAGLALGCSMETNGVVFHEAMLFTHAGLSGPVSLQASLHWYPGDTVTIDLLPGRSVFEWLMEQKHAGNHSTLKNLLSELIPNRLATRMCELHFPSQLPLPQLSEKRIKAFCEKLHAWKIVPQGTVGYGKAEVTRGGVDTRELSSKTMEAKKIPGLFFIGEVVDVTGWLGGYNFQWAWASGYSAGQAV